MPQARGPRSLAGLLVALIAATLVWWTQSGDTPTDGRPSDPAASSAARASATPGTPPSNGTDPDSGLPWVAVSALPPEASDTLALIEAGGPYPYPEDGTIFGNREGILPDREHGYYREYTVDTPGLDHRGARRIVGGVPGELYWTADHYGSFSRIQEQRR